MWVQDLPAAQESQQASVWDKLNPLNLGAKRTTPPVQTDIRWYDGWSMSNFTGHQFSAVLQSGPEDEVGSVTNETGGEND